MRFDLFGREIVEIDLTPKEPLRSLADAIGANDGILVDGQVVDLKDPVGSVWDGARLDQNPASSDEPPGVVELVGISGLDAAAHWRLAPGGYDLTSDGGPVLAVSTEGSVAVIPPSHNRQVFELGAEFRANGSVWQVRAPGSLSMRPRPVDGRRSFNRPPRRVPAMSECVIDIPTAPDEPVPRARMGWAMLAGPVLMGTIMALVFRPIMAVIALVGPLMMATSWIEDRWRMRRLRRENAAGWAATLQNLSDVLTTAASNEAAVRKRRHAGLTAVVQCCVEVGPTLWERRPHHSDYLCLPVGTGRTKWEPVLRRSTAGEGTADFESLIQQRLILPDGPVEVSLTPGTMIGVSGDRHAALALARGMLVRVATHHGPADVRVAVVASSADDWTWCTWLPHGKVDALSGRYRFGVESDDVEAVIESLSRVEDADVVVIVDADGLGPRIRTRIAALVDAGRIAALVIDQSAEDLPGTCDFVLQLGGSTGTLHVPQESVEPVRFAIDGLQEDVAELAARHLFGVDDPEEDTDGAHLPTRVSFESMGGPIADTAEMADRWRSPSDGLVTTLGMTESGPFEIDLVSDGPHGLVAGTTGSGKSELLRTLVGSLAGRYGPDHVTFALIDYKGGSAFDACSGLPHVVGLVTDLDRQLGKRALVSLEAELRYREELLRRAGSDDIAAYQRSLSTAPLPRLVVVIDEFAALAADIPEFIPSLVDMAQRGRSLGVHLILATQRPAGIVGDSIRANTNLRIALRVQTVADSRDVVDDPVAARLPRRFPGRGFVRLGPGELIPFQAARITSGDGSDEKAASTVRTVRFGWEPVALDEAQSGGSGPTDLERLVSAAQRAFSALEMSAPRPPWKPPLPDTLALGWGEQATIGRFGLVDEPASQVVSDLSWDPDEGGLLAFGVEGSGASDVLVAACFALAQVEDPGKLHIYGLDGGRDVLAVMECWPQVGAIVGASDRERMLRLVRRLTDVLNGRRDGASIDSMVLVVIERLDVVLSALDGPGDVMVRESLIRVIKDGPSFGIFPFVSASRPGAVPSAISSSLSQRFCFRLADPFEYAAVGLNARDIPELVRGRGFDAAGRLVQVGYPSPAAVDRLAKAVADVDRPAAIRVLPDRIPIEAVAAWYVVEDGGRFLPIGIGDRDLLPVGFQLHAGDHVLIAGPSRSGRTTALASIARLARSGDPEIEVFGLAPTDSILDDIAGGCYRSASDFFDAFNGRDGSALVLVDDAERFDHPSFTDLIGERREGLHIVAAGRADALRGLYQHWTRDIRRCRLGLSLRPQADLDGELWQMQFPRRGPTFSQPGRGYLVSGGEVELVQVASS